MLARDLTCTLGGKVLGTFSPHDKSSDEGK
jgi:hypothetical protein